MSSQTSPKQLQCQLNLAAGTGAGNASEIGCRSRGVGSAESHLVESIEELAPELKPQLLTHGQVLHQREIRAVGRGPVDDVATAATINPARNQRRREKCGR